VATSFSTKTVHSIEYVRRILALLGQNSLRRNMGDISGWLETILARINVHFVASPPQRRVSVRFGSIATHWCIRELCPRIWTCNLAKLASTRLSHGQVAINTTEPVRLQGHKPVSFTHAPHGRRRRIGVIPVLSWEALCAHGGEESPVDNHAMSGDKGGRVGAQPYHRLRHLFRPAHPSDGFMVQDPRLELRHML
jgi:hypothetical protein